MPVGDDVVVDTIIYGEDESILKIKPLLDKLPVEYIDKVNGKRGFITIYQITDVLAERDMFLSNLIEYINTAHNIKPPYKVILMSRCDGDLRTFIDNIRDKMSIDEQNTCYRQFLADMSKALETMNSYDIVHGDIKPENIGYVKDENQQYHFQLFDLDGMRESGSSMKYITMEYSVYAYARVANKMHDFMCVVSTFLQLSGILNKTNHFAYHFQNHEQLCNLLGIKGNKVFCPEAGTVLSLVEHSSLGRDLKVFLQKWIRYVQKTNFTKVFDEKFIQRLKKKFGIKESVSFFPRQSLAITPASIMPDGDHHAYL